MLFALGVAYLLSGPVVWWRERHRVSPAAEPERESLTDVR
jgi:hypothetical protein